MGSREELISTVDFALRFKVMGLRWKTDTDVRLAAEAIVAHMELCWYVIVHDPPPFPGPGYFPQGP